MPDTRVLMLTMHDSREYIMKVMRAGASGYILKEVSADEMVKAIETVYQGATYFCSAASQALFNATEEQAAEKQRKPLLSRREITILTMVAQGKSSKKIGQELDISVRTVETHRQNIKHKLEAKSTAEMVSYAMREGLVEG